MLKYRFLKNSAKVLSVSIGVLLLSNLILLLSLLIPSFEEKIGFLSKLPDLSIYIFTFLSYLALNDEKAAHRKIKDLKSQKIIKVLKALLIVIFTSVFFKTTVTNLLSGVVLNLFLVVTSFTFFMLGLSCWYFYRDKNEGKIKFVSLLSVVISLAYSIYKFIAYQNSSLALSIGLGDDDVLNYQVIQYGFCILQYTANIFMLVLLNKYYAKKEVEAEAQENQKPKPARPDIIDNIETEDGYGIDFVDDLS